MSRPLRIGIHLPTIFNLRDVFYTPLIEHLESRSDVHLVVLSKYLVPHELIKREGYKNVSAHMFPPPVEEDDGSVCKFFRKLEEEYLYYAATCRFGAINDLALYNNRLGYSPEQRRRHQMYLNFKKGERAAQPAPRSRAAFSLVYNLYHRWLGAVAPSHLRYIEELDLDLFAFSRMHHPIVPYWAKVLKKARVAMVGMVGSWDHPTTQGPTPCGMSSYTAPSRRIVQELVELHHLDEKSIVLTGKPQMDVHRREDFPLSLEQLKTDLGLAACDGIVTMGTNTSTLKEHEVSIAKRLATDFSERRYGNLGLVIRTHPQDQCWEKDFGCLDSLENVKIIQGKDYRSLEEMDEAWLDQRLLCGLMKHSRMVIQSRGSLALDAIAFNTPVIDLSFDGELTKSGNDSFIREYEVEHYKGLVEAHATWMVGSFDELGRAINGYLSSPATHDAGRREIRRTHIEPLDGNASLRILDHLAESARQAADGTLRKGQWNYSGLGDTNWAERERIHVEDFIRK